MSRMRRLMASWDDVAAHDAFVEHCRAEGQLGIAAARYREVVLREGDQVAVLGEATQTADPTAHADGGRVPVLRVVLGESPSGVLIGNSPALWA